VTCALVLSGVSSDSKCKHTSKLDATPLMRLSRLAEFVSMLRTGYLVPRSPFSVATALGVFRNTPSPPVFTDGLSSHRLKPSSETHLSAASTQLPAASRNKQSKSSSHEVPRPFNDITQRVGMLSGSTRTPSPFSLSQTPKGYILAELCSLISCCCRSWGS